MNLIKTIKAGLSLYRYDVIEPPKDGWDKSYKSPLYNWDEEGPKNEIAAFFLFNNEQETMAVAKNVLALRKEFVRVFNPMLSIWLTKTKIQEDVKMLDLSGCNDVVDLYVTLWKEQINIFREDFYKFQKYYVSKPLSLLFDDVKYLSMGKAGNRNKNAICKCNIYNFYNTIEENEQLPYACQGLTDFSNGKIFKNILEAKGINGYIFRETDATTFCLFDAQKLSFPETQLIYESE